MSNKCLVKGCGKITESAGALFSHMINTCSLIHHDWLDYYCKKTKIDYLGDRVNGNQNASKPLINCLKRDFTID
jgi:hypothetical protein